MPRKPKPPAQRTWDGLLDDDVTGADEAAEAMPMEFGKKRKAAKRGESKTTAEPDRDGPG